MVVDICGSRGRGPAHWVVPRGPAVWRNVLDTMLKVRPRGRMPSPPHPTHPSLLYFQNAKRGKAPAAHFLQSSAVLHCPATFLQPIIYGHPAFLRCPAASCGTVFAGAASSCAFLRIVFTGAALSCSLLRHSFYRGRFFLQGRRAVLRCPVAFLPIGFAQKAVHIHAQLLLA